MPYIYTYICVWHLFVLNITNIYTSYVLKCITFAFDKYLYHNILFSS